ncbi:hypothetical protein ACH4TQ_14755 [Streptomyces sp. NPDC021218]|uniref:hypothetical protein n=1 Tax=Streptomyces sp. NPDC021218 TaxID=3365119 RepID=UPI003791EFF5
MGSGTTTRPERRTWTVEIRTHSWGRDLLCGHCGPVPVGTGPLGIHARAVTHLAQHTRDEALAHHLRTCQCGEHACRWHPRHRGCGGSLVLLLTRNDSGHLWRLADTCRTCAAATAHAAVITEPPHHSPAAPRPPRQLSPTDPAAATSRQTSSTPITSESSLCEQGPEEVLCWSDPWAYD